MDSIATPSSIVPSGLGFKCVPLLPDLMTSFQSLSIRHLKFNTIQNNTLDVYKFLSTVFYISRNGIIYYEGN
jgi:hypothetical protein